MTPKEIFNQIYEMQAKLNRYIGRDTLNCPPENLKNWISDYLWALHDEATELSNCFRWKWWDTKVKENENNRFELFDEKNAKIELIDMIHFFISLCHLICNSNQKCKNVLTNLLFDIEVKGGDTKGITFAIIRGLVLYISTILSDILEETDALCIESLVIPLFIIGGDIGSIIKIFNMSPEEILDVYKKKCEINFKRQDQNYAMDTKSEEDNIKLAKSI